GAGGTGNPVGLLCNSGANTATVRLHRARVDINAGGGVKVDGCHFELVNKFIAQNGGVQSAFGGVLLTATPSTGLHALDFNTIAANTGVAGTATGVHCDSLTMAVTFDSNIVFANVGSNGGHQVDGQFCNYTYSDIGETVAGTGNIT